MALECRRTRRHSARWLLKPGMTRSAHGPSQIAIWRLHPTPKIAEALRREHKDRTTSRPCTIRVRPSACRAYKASFAKSVATSVAAFTEVISDSKLSMVMRDLNAAIGAPFQSHVACPRAIEAIR